MAGLTCSQDDMGLDRPGVGLRLEAVRLRQVWLGSWHVHCAWHALALHKIFATVIVYCLLCFAYIL